jgi:Mg-chelatase subunit ChlD
VVSQTTGRYTRIVKYRKGESRLAILHTLLKAASNGHYNLNTKRFAIIDEDMMGWTRREYESLTLILLVDVSKSTWAFIKVFKEILRSLTDYFHKHNDRVGLISLQGLQAKIYSHPTHNFRVVARGLSLLKFHGETPIADGLQSALNMARLEKGKNPGSRSIVILLSDCFPEPLVRGSSDVMDDPAYRNCLTAASRYKKEKVMLLVINPAFIGEEAELPGELLSQKIADASGGRLIKLHREKERRHAKLSPKEVEIIIKGIEDSLSRKEGYLK